MKCNRSHSWATEPTRQVAKQSTRAVAALIGLVPILTLAQVPSDTVYRNGKIYTVENDQPWAEAVAIVDGAFAYVGDNDGVAEWIGDETTVVDLNGRFVMPGIYDSHLHPDLALVPEKVGQFYFEQAVPTPEQVKQQVREFAEENPGDGWIVGRGWQPVVFHQAGITAGRAWLDEFMPDRPVYLIDNSTVHNMFNTKAMELAGLSRETRDPRHGHFLRTEDGDLLGIVEDGAQAPFFAAMPPVPQQAYEEAYKEAVDRLSAVGVVGAKFSQMNVPMIEAVHYLDESKQLTLRVETHLSWKDDYGYVDGRWDHIAGKRLMYRSELVNPNGVKFHFDGVTPSRSSLMLDPYRGEESWRGGDANLTQPEINDVVAYLDQLGIRVDAHCNGDGSAQQFLDAVEFARKKNGPNGPRHQMTHTVFVHPDDRPRFAELNVIPEFSPIYWYNSEFAEGAKTLLTDGQVEGAFPIAEILAAGGRGVVGTDWPVTPLEGIWIGFETLVTRENPWGEMEGAWGTPISLDQAIRMMTINGAWAMELEDLTGSIKAGKSADFIILDQNLFEIDASDIAKTRVLTTIFRGEPVSISDAVSAQVQAQPDRPLAAQISFH